MVKEILKSDSLIVPILAEYSNSHSASSSPWLKKILKSNSLKGFRVANLEVKGSDIFTTGEGDFEVKWSYISQICPF